METAIADQRSGPRPGIDDPPTEANLASTQLCDCDHPAIIAKVRELTAGIDGDDQAVADGDAAQTEVVGRGLLGPGDPVRRGHDACPGRRPGPVTLDTRAGRALMRIKAAPRGPGQCRRDRRGGTKR